jgi:ATP-dependent DNA helicase RecG
VFGPLTDLPGVGPARARALQRLGLADLRDLLLLVPKRILVSGPRVPISEARASIGREVTLAGTVSRVALQRFGRRSTLRVTLADPSGSIVALFFNQAWLRTRFPIGSEVEFHGRVVDSRGPAIASPRVGSPKKPLAEEGSIVPLYPLTDGIGQELLHRLCVEAVRRCGERLPRPRCTRRRRRLPSRRRAGDWRSSRS